MSVAPQHCVVRSRPLAPHAVRTDRRLRPAVSLRSHAGLKIFAATTNPDVSLRDLEVGPKIGAGSYGEVFLGRVNRGDYAEDVVIKKYVQKRGLDWKSFYEDELENCRRLQNCPGVASFLGVAGADVYLVWKFQGSVTLETLMDHPDSTIDALAEVMQADSPEAAFKSFTLGLCQAIESLHAEGFVHRDIKPGNILLAEQDDGSCMVKLIDLGGCADLRNQNFREDEAILDPVYGAPEQFIQKPSSGFGALLGGNVLEATGVPPTVEFDAYSAGLVLLQLGIPSLHSRAAMQMARKALQQCEDQDVAEWRKDSTTQVSCDFNLLDAEEGMAWDLVRGLLMEDPEERYSIDLVLSQHPYLKP